MSDKQPTGREKLILLAAAIPFLASLALAGFALSTGTLLAFGIGWPILQGVMYYDAFSFAKGEVDHPLVTSQVVLHWLMLVLVAAILVRAT